MKNNCYINVKVLFENVCVRVRVRVRPYPPFPTTRQKIRSPRYVIAHAWRDNWGYLNEWLVARAILGRLPSYCCFIFSSFEMSATSGVTVTVINPLVTSMAGGGSSGSGGSSSSSLATATWRRMLNWTVSPT